MTLANRRLDLGADRFGGHGSLGLNGRQAQDVGDHETAVDERPGHLARSRRIAPPHHVAQVDHVIQWEELVELDLILIQLGDALQAIILDRPDHGLAVISRGEEGRQGQRLGERPTALGTKIGQRFGPGVGLRDRRNDAATVARRISRKSGSVAYLSSIAKAIEPCVASAATA